MSLAETAGGLEGNLDLGWLARNIGEGDDVWGEFRRHTADGIFRAITGRFLPERLLP